MIDWQRVLDLHKEIGAEGLAEVLELFLDEVETVTMRLGRTPDLLEEDLHFLKGSAWNLGFRDFGALCQDGERKAAAGHVAAIDITAILACYTESKSMFLARIETVLAA
ncbi:Hpt domain-containing protein [Sinirhodobacter sp. WL0062]|uniref:Hpt domain-containing protein n=1 Tax=Rhodobacter flavimaris TaxID=2907145 RepID=A0ABS8YXJ5_9RHOB|nr:Hpt domain-containing protein [Sinirhodobacter sp. WL0062]